ncbi:unnamed protein product [Fasciola hepatica]|uniref:Uncharacterized protein n=1 Tax=Fasciola hepatica TaxID=6192 RepID=A0ABC9HHI2_FASHE
MDLPWPEPFEDGDIRTFLEDFEDLAELSGIQSDRGKLTALRALLKGRPRAVLDAARRGPKELKWAAAKDALIAGLDTPADRQDAMRRFKAAQLEVGTDPLVHAVALRSLLERALPTLDEASRADLLADRFVDSLPEPLRGMVRVARVGRSLNLVQLADVVRELAMIGVPVVNTAHVGGFMEEQGSTVEARQLEEAGCFCCGNVEPVLDEYPEYQQNIEKVAPEVSLLENSTITDELANCEKSNQIRENAEDCYPGCLEHEHYAEETEDMLSNITVTEAARYEETQTGVEIRDRNELSPKDIEGSIPDTFMLETSITSDEVEDVGLLNHIPENVENCNRDCSESQPDDGGSEDMSFAAVAIALRDYGSCRAQCETKAPCKVETEDVYPLPEQVPGDEVQPYASRKETAGSHIQDDSGMTQRMVLSSFEVVRHDVVVTCDKSQVLCSVFTLHCCHLETRLVSVCITDRKKHTTGGTVGRMTTPPRTGVGGMNLGIEKDLKTVCRI